MRNASEGIEDVLDGYIQSKRIVPDLPQISNKFNIVVVENVFSIEINIQRQSICKKIISKLYIGRVDGNP